MKIHFSSSREKTVSHFSSRISRDRDSCQGLPCAQCDSMKNIVAHDPLRINLSILNSFSVKHVYFTNGIGDWSSVTIITDESWQRLQLCFQGTHHLPTWVERPAL